MVDTGFANRVNGIEAEILLLTFVRVLFPRRSSQTFEFLLDRDWPSIMEVTTVGGWPISESIGLYTRELSIASILGVRPVYP